MSRRSALLAAAYAALAGLVAAGASTRLDQWAVNHAMPAARFSPHRQTLLEALVPLLHVRFHGALHVAAELVTVPASFALSLFLVGACCLVLPRRAAAAWAAAFVLGNAVEALCKSTLTRPALYHGALHLSAFDGSFPSGHTIRSVLVAAALGSAWPAARLPAAAWAGCSVVFLELMGAHVPSDLAGGLLLAALLVLGVRRVSAAAS